MSGRIKFIDKFDKILICEVYRKVSSARAYNLWNVLYQKSMKKFKNFKGYACDYCILKTRPNVTFSCSSTFRGGGNPHEKPVK